MPTEFAVKTTLTSEDRELIERMKKARRMAALHGGSSTAQWAFLFGRAGQMLDRDLDLPQLMCFLGMLDQDDLDDQDWAQRIRVVRTSALLQRLLELVGPA
ncbi:MAG: hypothetical protein ACREMA_20220 [Longimicrobiales bacterium]